MEKIVLSTTHSMGFCDEERPCGRCEELALLVEESDTTNNPERLGAGLFVVNQDARWSGLLLERIQ